MLGKWLLKEIKVKVKNSISKFSTPAYYYPFMNVYLTHICKDSFLLVIYLYNIDYNICKIKIDNHTSFFNAAKQACITVAYP